MCKNSCKNWREDPEKLEYAEKCVEGASKFDEYLKTLSKEQTDEIFSDVKLFMEEYKRFMPK